MTDEDYDRLQEITDVDTFVEFILERDPKTSAADMREVWMGVHVGDPPPKAEFKRARDAVSAILAAGAAPPPEPGMLEQLRELIRNKLTIEGKSTDLKTLTMVYTFLEQQASKGVVSTTSTENWDRLTIAEGECLQALTAKLNGQPLTPEDEWYVVLLSRVPDALEATHPAHVPLPGGQPTLTVVPK